MQQINARTKFENAIVTLILGTCFVLTYAIGSISSYILILLAFILIITIARKGGNPNDYISTNGLIFFASFMLILVAFTLSARAVHDIVHAANFAMLVVFAPLNASLGKFASTSNSMRITRLALWGAFIALLIASYQVLVQNVDRASAIGSDPIWSAQAAILLGFLALLGFTFGKGRSRLIFLFGPVFGVVVSLLSLSRGPLLAVPALAFIFLVWGTKRPVRNIALFFLGALAVLGALWFIWPHGFARVQTIYEMTSELVKSGQILESSGGQRELMWRAGFAAFLDSPLFGYGWGHMLPTIVRYLPNGFASFTSDHHHLHSDVLDFGVSAGALGIVAYVLLLVGPSFACSISPKDSQYGFRQIAIALVSTAYLIFGMTYLTFGYEFHTTLYVCLCAVILGYCRDDVPAADFLK